MIRLSLREKKDMEKGGRKAKGTSGRSETRPGCKPAARSSGLKSAAGDSAIPPSEWPADKSAPSLATVTPLKKEAILARNTIKRFPESRGAGVVFSLTGSDHLLRRTNDPAEAEVKSSSSPGSMVDSLPGLAFPEAVCKNRRQAAKRFSEITDGSFKPFPYGELEGSEKFEDMALCGMKFISSVNKCVGSYDAAVRGVRKRAEEDVRLTRRKLNDLEASSSRRIELLEGQLSRLNAERDKAVRASVRLKAEVSSQSEELRTLTNQLAGAKASRDAHGCKACTAEYPVFLGELKEMLGSLSEARIREVDLAQITGNLELVALLQSSEPPDLNQEKTKLCEWKDGFDGAGTRFDEIAARIREDIDSQLVLVSDDAVAPVPEAGSIEEEASALGVVDPGGSNEGVSGISDLAVTKALGPDP